MEKDNKSRIYYIYGKQFKSVETATTYLATSGLCWLPLQTLCTQNGDTDLDPGRLTLW